MPDETATTRMAFRVFTEPQLRELKRRWRRKTSKADRWWSTYNAALTGYLARNAQPETAHTLAVENADLAHGKLKS